MPEQSAKSSVWKDHFVKFDIDRYINPIVPRSRLYLLPKPISYFLGYRAPDSKLSQPAQPLIWLSALIGGFIGVAIITNVFLSLPLLGGHQVPIVIASFGAAAVLEYNTIESPLSQPRNLILGHFLSALVGVGITKCFETLGPERFEELRWLAGSISVGLASAVMGITKTIHPPAGATALLASTSADITELGWWFLPLVLLGSCLMGSSALIVNNVLRRWPIYWWTAADLSKKPKENVQHVKDVEKNADAASVSTGKDSGYDPKSTHLEKSTSRTDSDATLEQQKEHDSREAEIHCAAEHQVTIQATRIVVPDWMQLDDFEKNILSTFEQRLRQRGGN